MNGLASHVIINPMLLDASGRDAWIAVICTGILFLPWCAFVAWLMRKSGQQKLQSWIAERTHPVVSWLLFAPIIVQLYLIGGMTASQTADWAITYYLPTTPKLVLILGITLLGMLCALWGLRVLAILSIILLPFVILLGYFVSLSNSDQKDFHLLKPFVENGWGPVLDGMLYAAGGLTELIVVVTAMQHRIKTKIRPWHLMLYGFLSLYIMLGPIIGAITEFGPKEAALQMESPFEQWRLVKLGPYVEHVDFFSIYQWMSGATIRIGGAIFLLIELIPNIRKKVRNWTIGSIGVSYIFGSLVPVNFYTFYDWMHRYYIPFFLIVDLSVSFLWLTITWLPNHRRREKGA